MRTCHIITMLTSALYAAVPWVAHAAWSAPVAVPGNNNVSALLLSQGADQVLGKALHVGPPVSVSVALKGIGTDIGVYGTTTTGIALQGILHEEVALDSQGQRGLHALAIDANDYGAYVQGGGSNGIVIGDNAGDIWFTNRDSGFAWPRASDDASLYGINVLSSGALRVQGHGSGVWFSDQEGTVIAVIAESGNVGINTPAPQEKLTVEGGSAVVYPTTYALAERGVLQSSANAPDLGDAYAIDISGPYAYVVNYTGHSLSVFDIADPENPSLVSYVRDDSVGGQATALRYPRDIHVADGYAYVASAGDNGISIIDIRIPSAPREVGALKDDSVGGSATSLQGTGGIYVSGRYAFATGPYDDGLSIITIENPTAPTEDGFIKDSMRLDQIEDVFVRGDYAYAVSSNASTLSIIDISDPLTPSIVGIIVDDEESYKPPGSSVAQALSGARSLYVSDGYAYVAGTADDALSIIDVSDPSRPAEVGFIVDGAGAIGLDEISHVTVAGDFAYTVAGGNLFVDGDHAFSVIDISDPTNPKETAVIRDDSTGEIGTFGTGLGGAEGVAISGNYAFIASRRDHALSVIALGGINAQTADFGAARTAQLQVAGAITVGNELVVRTSVHVGPGGVVSEGPLSAGVSHESFIGNNIGIHASNPHASVEVRGGVQAGALCIGGVCKTSWGPDYTNLTYTAFPTGGEINCPSAYVGVGIRIDGVGNRELICARSY